MAATHPAAAGPPSAIDRDERGHRHGLLGPSGSLTGSADVTRVKSVQNANRGRLQSELCRQSVR